MRYSRFFKIIRVSECKHSVMPSDLTIQIRPSAKKHIVTCSQHYETHRTVRLFGTARVIRHSNQDSISFTFMLFTDGAMLQFDIDKEKVLVTMLTDRP